MDPGRTIDGARRINRELVAFAVGYQRFYNDANVLVFKTAGDALHLLMVATLRYAISAVLVLPVARVRWRHTTVSKAELGGAAGLLTAIVGLSGLPRPPVSPAYRFRAALVFLIVASAFVGHAVSLTFNTRVWPTFANTFNHAAPLIALWPSALLLKCR